MPKHDSMTESSRASVINKSRVHVFQGQDLAEPVLSWLRRQDRPKGDPVETLVTLEFNRARWMPGIAVDEDSSIEIVRLVNKTMELWCFGLVHTATATPSDWTVTWKPQLSKRATPDQMLAFHNCCVLKQHALLHRIRRCARPGCGAWFFAKFEHQKCHSDECRIAVLSADEARREARKKYMRDLRAKKKVKKFRSREKGGEKS
jgi:hypothetical protein